MTPLDDGVTFLESAEARAALAELQAEAAALPHVLGTSDPAGALAAGPEAAVTSGSVSSDGRVAARPRAVPGDRGAERGRPREPRRSSASRPRAGSPLQIEMGGDLFFAFEEPATGTGELIGLVAAVVILLLAFGSLIAMGLPIGMAVFGLAVGISSMSLSPTWSTSPAWLRSWAA